MTGHVSAQSLARYAEGLLRRGRATRIRAHLAACPQCAAEQARLAAVAVVLRDVPAAPLPPAVAARLDAALIAESARRAAQPAGGAQGNGAAQPAGAPEPADGPEPAGAGRSGDGGPGQARRPAGPAGRWRWLQAPAAVRGLAAAAAVVVLGGVGYGIAQSVSSTSSGLGTSSSASSGREAKPAAGVPGAGPNGGSGMHQNSSAAGSATAIAVTRSGTRYQPGTLGRQAAAVLADHPPAAQGNAPGPAGPLARQGNGAALQGCVHRIAAGRPVQLVDEGSYLGRSALIIVVQDHPSMVYVTSPGCAATRAGVWAQAPLAAAG
jgi:hypothetical protein